MDRLPADTLLHVVNQLNRCKVGPARVVDYRLFRVGEPGADGKLRQMGLHGPAHPSESMEGLLRRGYTVLRTEWRPIPEGRQCSELWAHVVLLDE